MTKILEFGKKISGKDYILRPGVHGLIRRADDLVAVVFTPDGYFLLGGGLQRGESLRGALQREAREECGCTLRIGRRIGVADEFVFAEKERTHFQKRFTFLAASIVTQDASVATETDHLLRWMSIDEAIRSLAHESHQWAVQHAFAPGPIRR